MQDFVQQYEWAKKDKDDGIPEKRILMIKQNNDKNQASEEWDAKNTLVKSDDFKKFKTIVKGGNRFVLTRNYLYVAKIGKEKKKVLSYARRTSDFTKFTDMRISEKGIHKFDFNIVEMSTGGVFLFLTRPDKNIQAGNMYISDNKGARFTVTLQGVPYLTKHEFDFIEVKSLPGVYIANVYDKIAKATEEEYLDYYTDGNEKRPSKRPVKKLPDRKTMITFNGGGDWSPIPAPAKSSAGKTIKCDIIKGCSLHLHNLSSNKYPFPYSVKSAIGLIIGVGNIGTQLSDLDKDLNTYFSRDGGLTWYEILKGPHIAEYGDHGGIIAMAPFKHAFYIIYSANEGMTWNKVKLSRPSQISNILIEPNSISTRFCVIGSINHHLKNGESKNTGALMSVDFSELHQNQCQGLNTLLDPNSDYELWSPSNGLINSNDDACFYGKKTQFIRRKRDRKCINGELIEKEIFEQNCECTRKDYECDEGYKLMENGNCEPVDANQTVTAPEDCQDYYYINRGYRKIPGDS